MNDKKQIKEMAKDIVHQKMFGPCIFESCPFRRDDEILCNNCKVAQYLHNKHYCKIPENAVVLTMEAYQDLNEYKNIAEQRKFNLDYANVELRRLSVELNSAEESNAEANRFLDKYRKELEIIKQELVQSRKETAKEIFDKIIWFAVKRIGETSGDSYYQISFDRLNELAKQFGVEVNK